MGEINNIFSDVPLNWSVSKLKYFSSIYTGNSLNDAEKNKFSNVEDNQEGRIYVSSKDINVHNNSCNYDTDLIIPYDETKYKVAPLGSSLLCIEGGSAGKKLTFTKQEVCFVNKLACFTGENEESSKFIYYYLQSYGFKVQFNSSLSGLIGGVSLTNLNDFQVPIPPKQTQIRIAEFLDKKTAEIDAIIKKKEALLLRLEEKKKAIINEVVTGKKVWNGTAWTEPSEVKDSGIKWIGDIPAYWKKTKLKYIGICKGRIGFRGYSVDDLVFDESRESSIVLGGTNIMRNGTISYDKLTFLSIEKYYESPEIMLEGGEILITKVGAGVGENAIYKKVYDKVTINPNVMIFKPFDREMSDFINFYLFSDSVKSHVLMESSKSGAQPAINQSFIQDLEIFLPTTFEQLKIVEHIISNINKIDKVSGKTLSQIEKLKEYRQALISEAITGKLKIV